MARKISVIGNAAGTKVLALAGNRNFRSYRIFDDGLVVEYDSEDRPMRAARHNDPTDLMTDWIMEWALQIGADTVRMGDAPEPDDVFRDLPRPEIATS